jgi:hypothetical protein
MAACPGSASFVLPDLAMNVMISRIAPVESGVELAILKAEAARRALIVPPGGAFTET